MHPRQATLATEVRDIMRRMSSAQDDSQPDDDGQEKTAGVIDLVSYVDRHVSAGGQPILWQYQDPAGNLFWLDSRITTAIRSPYGGPQFTPKPRKVIPSQIGRNIENLIDDESDVWI